MASRVAVNTGSNNYEDRAMSRSQMMLTDAVMISVGSTCMAALVKSRGRIVLIDTGSHLGEL